MYNQIYYKDPSEIIYELYYSIYIRLQIHYIGSYVFELEKVKMYFCYIIILHIMQSNINHIRYIVDTSNSR